MNLEQARNIPFDDILFMTMNYINSKKQLLPEFIKTDELFLRSVYDLYNEIENNKAIIFFQYANTGMTTALQFIACYYSLHYNDITILTTGNYCHTMENTFNFFCDILCLEGINNNFMSNNIICKSNNVIFCNINLLGDNVFDIANLKGLIIFDTKKEIKNFSKYNDLLKNWFEDKKKYDRLIFNFPESESIVKLAKEYNIKNKKIKIF